MKNVLLLALGMRLCCYCFAQDSLAHYSATQLEQFYTAKTTPEERRPYLLALLKKYEKTDTSYARWASELGHNYFDSYDFQNAGLYFQESVEVWRTQMPQHLAYPKALESWGLVFVYQGQYSRAEQIWLQAQSSYKTIVGEQHLNYADMLANLGGLYSLMGLFWKSEPLMIESLNIRRALSNEKTQMYAMGLNNLAALYHNLSDYSKAAEFYLQALNIQKELVGEKHIDYAFVADNLGMFYYNIKNYDQAQFFYQKALELV